MPEFALAEPFDIDCGELDGIAPQVVFCLGFEICQLMRLLDDGDGKIIDRTMHTANASRVKRMCIRRGRKFRIESCAECPDQWSYLTIADADGSFGESEAA